MSEQAQVPYCLKCRCQPCPECFERKLVREAAVAALPAVVEVMAEIGTAGIRTKDGARDAAFVAWQIGQAFAEFRP